MCKISVIVPVYKVEQYLKRCVDSILGQTFNDFECILIDDGSPDNCPAMCDELAKTDNRIKVIHKENGGLSDARNAGIDVAKGEYITFIDSDDWVHPQLLEILSGVLDRTNAGFVSCKHEKTSEYVIGEMLDTKNEIGKAEVFSSEEIFDHFYDKYLNKIWMTAWAKMYNRHVFDNLRFQKGALHEDEILLIPSIQAAKNVAVIDAVLYYYFMSDSSIIRSGLNEKKYIILDIAKDRCAFFENDPKQYALACKEYYEQYLGYAIGTKLYFKENTQYFKKYERNIKKELLQAMKNTECCRMFKLTFALSFVSCRLASKLCQKYFPHITNRVERWL